MASSDTIKVLALTTPVLHGAVVHAAGAALGAEGVQHGCGTA